MNASLFASTERHFIWHWQYSAAVERGVARLLEEYKYNSIYVQPKPIRFHDTGVCVWFLFPPSLQEIKLFLRRSKRKLIQLNTLLCLPRTFDCYCATSGM